MAGALDARHRPPRRRGRRRGATCPEAFRLAITDLAGIETALDRLGRKMTVLVWMVGGLYVVSGVLGLPALWLLVRIAAKVGALG